MVEEGLGREDALKRAARQHGIKLQHAIPKLEAVRAAIQDYRELFKPGQLVELNGHRRVAAQAMIEFSAFQPRLFGALLHGDGPLDLIQLMLLADSPEQVMHHLSDRHIPWRDTEVVLEYSGRRQLAHPALRFLAGESTVELVVFEQGWRSDPPLDALTGKQLETLGVEQLNALVAQTAA